MKDFYRFLLSVVAVIGIVCIVDYSFGLILDKTMVFIEEPKYKRIQNANEEMVILCASRAYNQYVTEILCDSLDVSAFNYGVAAQNIYTNYAILSLLTEKSEKKPKYVIWDFYYTDILDTPGWNTEKLGVLYTAYNYNDIVKETIKLQGNKNYHLVRLIKLYKFNSKLPYLYRFNKVKQQDYSHGGYLPLYVEHSNPIEIRNADRSNYDIQKLSYIDKFIELCKKNDIKLYVFISPAYYKLACCEDSKDWASVIRNKCLDNSVPFFNHEQDSLFLQHPEWFYNTEHLNDAGAQIYTLIVAKEVKDIIKAY